MKCPDCGEHMHVAHNGYVCHRCWKATRHRTIGIAVNDDQYKAIQQMAKDAGKSISAFVRDTIFGVKAGHDA